MTATLSGEKILITGPAGQIAFPLACSLVGANEVWGVARFGDADTKARCDDAGIVTRTVDLATGDFGDLPDDFTYVLHLAAFQGPTLDYDEAIRVNAEATGLLLAHCRNAKAALVMSTHSVYRPPDDPAHVYVETDPLGDANNTHAPTYSMSKIGQEAVARTCARLFDLPVTIARMNASYGNNGGLPFLHLQAMLQGQPVVTRWDPCTYSPIHEDDIAGQTAALLAAASVPATIVNWAGDEAVSVQEWCAYFGQLTGVEPAIEVRYPPGTQKGAIADVTRRRALTGACTVTWRDGMRRMVEAHRPSS